MHHGDVVVRQSFPEPVHAVADGFLAGFAPGFNPAKLGDAVLPGVPPQSLLPALQTDHADLVDFRVALKALQGVNNHGLVVNVDELLGNVHVHPVSHASGDDDGGVH